MHALDEPLSPECWSPRNVGAQGLYWDRYVQRKLKLSVSIAALIVLTRISIFGKNHFTTIYTHTSTASNSIDMDPFLLQTVELSSNYDTVHFGGDLVREEDKNMSDRIRRCSTRSTLPVVLLVFEPLMFRGVGFDNNLYTLARYAEDSTPSDEKSNKIRGMARRNLVIVDWNLNVVPAHLPWS